MRQRRELFMRTRKANLTSASVLFIPWARSKQIIKGLLGKLQERERSRACMSRQIRALTPSGQAGLQPKVSLIAKFALIIFAVMLFIST